MRTAFRWLALGSLAVSLTAAAPARTRPHYGGTLRIEVREANWQDNDCLRSLVLDSLTATGPAGEALPSLATRWEAENGERRWVFTLRGGVLWHDGTPLTAEAVAASLRAQTSASELAGSTIRASGDSIIIENTRPMANLPAEVALSRFAIARIEQGLVLGTGAFRVASADGNHVVLAANDAYWRGRPYLDEVEIGTGRTIRDQWMNAGVGRTDIATIPAEMLLRAQQERLRIVVSRNSELITLVATRTGESLDVRLRQALAATVDRAALLNFVFQKQGEIAPSLLPNRITGYAALFPSAPDAARARELRAEAPRPMVIGYDPADSTLQLVAERIALNAREDGLQASASATGDADFTVERVPLPSANMQVAIEQWATAVQAPIAGSSSEIEDVYRSEHELLAQANLIPLLYVPRAYAVAQRIVGATLDESGCLDMAGAWIEEPR
jgi:MarR-like DNA-binding transcriptional regulator SgrR of sgrS sRNA